MNFFIFILFIIIFIFFFIFYYFNVNYEKFFNFSSPDNEINNIIFYYNEIKQFYNLGYTSDNIIIIKKKEQIKNSFNIIELSINDNNIKYDISNIYFDITKYLNNINDNEFFKLINKLKNLINNYNNLFFSKINNINSNFNKLNSLYKNIFINKIIIYDNKKKDIDNLIILIHNDLLSITSQDNLYNSGIILILNTTLKRAYERNDLIDINNNINSFNTFIFNISKSFSSYNYNTSNNILFNNKLTNTNSNTFINIDIIKKDFNNIYNSFDLLNNIYNNNINLSISDEKEISIINNLIFSSLDNISNYFPFNYDYKNKIISIKNVIIIPLINKELFDLYKQKDYININKIKNKFYNSINEIKNIIIDYYNKTSSDYNLCINNILKELNFNNFPINVSELNNCNKSFFNNQDIIIDKKIIISNDNGLTWNKSSF